MNVKVLCSLCLVAVALIGCENMEKKEEGAKKESVENPKHRILLDEDGEEYYATIKPSRYVENRNVQIEGRTYSYIKYAVEGNQIRIICLWSEEDELVIPSTVDSKKVYLLGGTTGEIPKELRADKFGTSNLAWLENEDKRYEKIVIPEGVERIYDMAFQGVKADIVDLPSSMYDTGKRSFISSKINTVIVKNPRMQISEQAFAYSTIREIELPSQYEGKLKKQCFESSELEQFDWPANSSETSIGYAIFHNCKKLKKIHFPENQDLIYIADFTFVGCRSMTELIFPASTKRVKYRSNPYGDDYREGAEILHFLGEETELDGCLYARGDGEYEFITVGKIIAPKGAKAIQYARKAKRIRKLSPKIRRKIKQGMSEDVCGLLFNYSDKEYEKDIQLDMVEYVEE